MTEPAIAPASASVSATLEPIPTGEPASLAVDRPYVHRAEPAAVETVGVPLFVLVPPAGRDGRWVLFDTSGTIRVDAVPVAGGVLALDDGAIIRGGGARFRFRRDTGAERCERPPEGERCSYCRGPWATVERDRPGAVADEHDLGALRCGRCGRPIHVDCARHSRRCGRCFTPLEVSS